MEDHRARDLFGPEPETLRALLRDHPALVLTASYLMIAAIGLTYTVLLFADFGVEILNYADAADFLLAAVREPVAIVLFLAAFPLMWLLRRWDDWTRRRYPRFWNFLVPTWMRRPVVEGAIHALSVVAYAWLFTTLYADHVSDRIKAGEGDRVVVELQDGTVLGADRPAILIGGTTRYVFLYDPASAVPTAVPVGSANRIQVLSARAMERRIADLPLAVTNNAVAHARDASGTLNLYSFMGLDRSRSWAGITDRSFRYDGAWSEIAPVPGRGRIAATAQTVAGRVYLFGGYTVDPDGSEASVPNVDIYDPASGAWSRGADIPTPVDDAVSGVWRDSLIYLVSGWHDTANVRLVQVYDPAADRWFEASPVPGPGVFGHAGGVVGDAIVYIDGVVRNEAGPRYSLRAQAWRGAIDPADPARIDWQPIARHPGPALYRAAAGVCGNRVLIAGGSATPYNYDGIGYSGAPAEPESRLLAYDLADDRWLDLGPVPEASMDHRGLLLTPTDGWILGGMREGQTVTDAAVRLPLNRTRACVAP